MVCVSVSEDCFNVFQNFMTSTLHRDREMQLKSAIEYSLADLGLIETPSTSVSSSPAVSVNSLTMNSNWCPLAHTMDDLIYQVRDCLK